MSRTIDKNNGNYNLTIAGVGIESNLLDRYFNSSNFLSGIYADLSTNANPYDNFSWKGMITLQVIAGLLHMAAISLLLSRIISFCKLGRFLNMPNAVFFFMIAANVCLSFSKSILQTRLTLTCSQKATLFVVWIDLYAYWRIIKSDFFPFVFFSFL